MVTRLLPSKAGVQGPNRASTSPASTVEKLDPFRLQNLVDRIQYFEARLPILLCLQAPVPELCQNPIHLVCRELLFEREQLPQVVDTRHIQIELIERLEPGHILRNQQVSGSSPEGGSTKSII